MLLFVKNAEQTCLRSNLNPKERTMIYCSNCGKQLKETVQYCTNCGNHVKKHTALSLDIASAKDIVCEKSKEKNHKTIFGIAIIALIIFFMAFFMLHSNSNYYSNCEDAVDAFAEGLTESNFDKIAQAMFTENMIDQIGEKQAKQISSIIEFVNAAVESYSGKKAVWSIKIISKTKFDKNNLKAIELDYYENYHTSISIEKGYEIKAELNVCGETNTIYFNAIYFKDDGWKVSHDIFDVI